jgi:hypothetical protein
MVNKTIPAIFTFPILFFLAFIALDTIPAYMDSIFIVFVALIIFMLYGAFKSNV